MSETKTKKMIISTTPAMHARIQASAEREKVSMAEYVREAVQQRLDLQRSLYADELVSKVVESEY